MFLKVGDSGGRKPEKGSAQDSAWIPLVVSNGYESAQMKTEEKLMAIYTQRQDLVSFPLTMKKDEGRIKCVGELISIWYFFTCPSFTPECP